MNTDTIADLMIRIKNAGLRIIDTVEIPYSRYKLNMLETLLKAGYIKGVSYSDSARDITVELKYHGKSETHVIAEIYRVSKPGRRVYMSGSDIEKRLNNKLGSYIVSTSQGIVLVEKKSLAKGFVFTNTEEVSFKGSVDIGGEVIGYVS